MKPPHTFQIFDRPFSENNGDYSTSSLIQEEDEKASPCFCFQADPMHTLHHDIQDSLQSREQKHKHQVEWIQVIRISLFPILLSIVVVLILIRILYMIHDADHLLTFLQTVLGLFGATASGYAYAQAKQPGDVRPKNNRISKRDANDFDLDPDGSPPDDRDRNIP